MKTKTRLSSVIVRAMLIPVLVFGLASLAPAQTAPAEAKPAAAKAKSPTGAEPSGGPQEGIKVHGHWTIEVRNPDGSFVSRHEFENSLGRNGREILAMLVGAYGTVTRWQIGVGGACGSSTSPLPCMIAVTPRVPLREDIGVIPVGTVEFAGSTTATHDASITSVDTEAALNWPGTNTSAVSIFTDRTLTSPVNVVVGQIIQVTVVISFS